MDNPQLDKMPPRPRTKRQLSGEATIQSMFDAGWELLKEWLQNNSPVEKNGSLEFIRATDISRRTGQTSGAFFHWWGSQPDYRSDLLQFVVEKLKSESLTAIEDAHAEHANPEPTVENPPRHIASHLSALALAAMGVNRDVRLYLSVSASTEASVSEGLADFYSVIRERLEAIFAELLIAYRLESVSVVSRTGLIATTMATADGSLGNHEVEASLVGDVAHMFVVQVLQPK